MAKWIDVGDKEQFPIGSKNCVDAGDELLVVCNVDGQLVAVSNICPHARLPLIDGDLQGQVLTCIYHNYAYDVTTGKNVDQPDQGPLLETYPVRVTEADRVEICVGEG